MTTPVSSRWRVQENERMKTETNENEEYQAYLDELEANRKHTIQNECKQGRHNWHHNYNYVVCAVCHEPLEQTK